MKLPDGEHLIEGKIYIVTDGEIVEVKDAPVEEAMSTEEAVVEEEVTMATDTEEEVVTDEEVVEEEVAMAVDATADAEAVLAIVTPILDERINEVLQLIAEIKNMMPIVEEVEVEEEIAMRKLSVNERFTAFRETFKK
jgi:rRNA maturation endonuclease Nob1